jgi:hypothetical protein
MLEGQEVRWQACKHPGRKASTLTGQQTRWQAN